MQDPAQKKTDHRDHQEISFEILSEIFDQIAEAPAHQRSQLLDKLCPNEKVRQQISNMLAADGEFDPLLDHQLGTSSVAGLDEARAGETIAGYKLLKELARGGMGVVYLAERFEPVHQKVAFKVIKPGVDTREVIARFDAERQALSLMDHPHIAKVFDAGTTHAGRPFFAMELVDGCPINEYCENRQLSITSRLELFVTVCRAIQHAHQKGIIHRDIKPSNVLVAEYDKLPTAKVIDFGVAKAINHSLSDITIATGLGQIIGTFDYMSPEQTRATQADVDTRSDIYSLGVLLYELLTGDPPFDRERLRSVDLDELLRIIRTEDPPRPSQRCTDGSNFRESSQRKRLLRGELDWIVMRAMEKDRNRRYATPIELATDIERFLRGESVAACPPTALYQFSKFAKRNKLALAMSTIVATSLVLGLVATTFQAVRASRAEAAAQAAKKFLIEDLLGLAGEEQQLAIGVGPDPNIKLLMLLKNAADRVDERFADAPEIKANLKATLASSFNSIGRYDDAARLYREYLKFLQTKRSKPDADTIRVMRQLTRIYIDENSQIAEAERLGEEALTQSRSYLGEQHPLTLLLLSDIASLYQKQLRHQDAIDTYVKCLEIRRSLFGDQYPDTLVTMSNLASVYESLGRLDDAAPLFEHALSAFQETLPADDIRLAAAFHNLGRCYLKRSRKVLNDTENEQAQSMLSHSAELFKQILGPDHPSTLDSQRDLAQSYWALGQFDRAATVLEETASRLSRQLGPRELKTLEVLNMLGWTYLRQSQLTQAEYVLVEAYDILREARPADPLTLQVMANLAIVRYRLGKLTESMRLDEQTVKLAAQILGDRHSETIAAKTRLGLACLDLGEFVKGRESLEQAFRESSEMKGAHKVAAALANSFAYDFEADPFSEHATRSRELVLRWTTEEIESVKRVEIPPALKLQSMISCGARYLKIAAWSEAEEVLRECVDLQSYLGADAATASNLAAMIKQAELAQRN